MKVNQILLTVMLLVFVFNVSANSLTNLHSSRASAVQNDSIASGKGKLIDLGPQIRNAAIQAAAFLKDKEGRNLVFTVARGQPAHLIGYELINNTLIVDVPLDSMVGAWSIAGSREGVLYIGGGHGRGTHLWQYTPAE